SAIFADVLVRFYTGEPGPFAPAIPVGLSLSGDMAAANPMLDAVAGNARYPRGIVKLNDTADPLALIRNALSAQFDQNDVVLLTGPATNRAGSEAPPVVAAYRAYRPMPYDAPAAAMAAALYAVRPQENYFTVSGPGTLTVPGASLFRFPPPAG